MKIYEAFPLYLFRNLYLGVTRGRCHQNLLGKFTAGMPLFLLICCVLFTPLFAHTFRIQDENFLLDDKRFVIRSGELHYPRIPRLYWRDRMRKAKAMGLNTICTYVFWNVHEPTPGQYFFRDNLDVAEYVKIAQEEGLWVILRPGPYICSEWDFGGLPAWLLNISGLQVRSHHPQFLEAANRYLQRVGQELAPYQITRGGPILMVQIENEYGSFGDDLNYMEAIHDMIVQAGFDVLLFTSDGTSQENLQNGTLPNVLAAINFNDNHANEFEKFAEFRSHVPRMCGEYWAGWFDHWGQPHQTRNSSRAVEAVDWMLSKGISLNLYMFHGGTTFGFMNGANIVQDTFFPDVTSYDYDAPLDEAGRPTPKFFALRDVLKKYLSSDEVLPSLPEPLPMIAIPAIHFQESASLFSLLQQPISAPEPLTMEQLHQSYGFVLYRKKFQSPASGRLEVRGVRDYAMVWQDATLLGTLDRRFNELSLQIELNSDFPLDILVENMGRVNFGKQFVDEGKGLLGPAKLQGEEILDWEIYSLPLDDLSQLVFTQQPVEGPAFYKGTFSLDRTGDTFLDMRGWGKGHVWVNGHHLGRYWNIGPQWSLFLPAVWLHQGLNEIIILDLDDQGIRTLSGHRDPITN